MFSFFLRSFASKPSALANNETFNLGEGLLLRYVKSSTLKEPEEVEIAFKNVFERVQCLRLELRNHPLEHQYDVMIETLALLEKDLASKEAFPASSNSL